MGIRARPVAVDTRLVTNAAVVAGPESQFATGVSRGETSAILALLYQGNKITVPSVLVYKERRNQSPWYRYTRREDTSPLGIGSSRRRDICYLGMSVSEAPDDKRKHNKG